jgi:uncharacterized protein with HEPN domain
MSHDSNDREIIDYLNDIIDAISDILSFTADTTYDEFEQDKKTQYAVIHCLEIVGEAVNARNNDNEGFMSLGD